MNDTRQEFEALARTMPYDVTRNATGRYKWYETQCAWEVWQHQAARIAELEAQVKALQRVPLSEKQVEDLIYAKHFRKGCAALSYASTQVNLNWYRLGLRDGERAHGITQENQG